MRPDWQCPVCAQPNSSEEAECINCECPFGLGEAEIQERKERYTGSLMRAEEVIPSTKVGWTRVFVVLLLLFMPFWFPHLYAGTIWLATSEAINGKTTAETCMKLLYVLVFVIPWIGVWVISTRSNNGLLAIIYYAVTLPISYIFAWSASIQFFGP